MRRNYTPNNRYKRSTKNKYKNILRKPVVPSQRFQARALRQFAWLSQAFGAPSNLVSAARPYINHLVRIWEHRGISECIAHAKAVRLYVTRYLSGEPLTEKMNNVKLTNVGLPKAIGPELLAWCRSNDPVKLRALLSVLTSTRVLHVPPKLDVTSIVTPSPSEKLDLFNDMRRYVFRFWRILGHSRQIPESHTHWKSFHLTTKSGPNGQALFSWWEDFKALPRCLRTSLEEFGGPEIVKRFQAYDHPKLAQFCELVFGNSKKGGSFRKLRAIPDKEGKTRIIAIGDYFSQTILYPFHKKLFTVLRKINQDRTFSQGDFLSTLPSEGPFYSIDLSNATDRFPIDLISLVLKGAFSPRLIDLWKKIMVDYPFEFEGKDVSYKVGNPMGFYSSWNSFALSHHFVVYYCCCKLGMSWKTAPYALLGDDIVIGDEALAREYQRVLNLLDVPFSKMKTHVSKHTFEFAKRWFHKGSEISPFPLAGLAEVSSRYNLMVNLILSTLNKGWIPSEGVSKAIAKWYECDGKPSRFRQTICTRSAVCEIVTLVMSGKLKGKPAIQQLVQLKENRDFEYDIDDEQASYLFQRTCLEAFAESQDPKKLKKGKPLGLFAETLVLHLSEQWELLEKDIYPFYLPPLNVYGKIEEQYLALNREAWEIDALRGGDWPLLLRAMTIPSSDEVFLVRNYDILPMASANIGKRIFDKIAEFRMLMKMGYG